MNFTWREYFVQITAAIPNMGDAPLYSLSCVGLAAAFEAFAFLAADASSQPSVSPQLAKTMPKPRSEQFPEFNETPFALGCLLLLPGALGWC